MTLKITLVTPPDLFQNNQHSILFLDLSDQDQVKVSNWLSTVPSNEHINIYFYHGEHNVEWLMHALAISKVAYVGLNNITAITDWLAGYILSKPNVYFSTDNDDVAELFSCINNNRVENVIEFLERVFSG